MGDYTDAWGKQLLRKLGAPPTSQNLALFRAWAQAEGSTARFNPFDTTQPAPGATNFNSVGVKNYRSAQQGLDATYQTLINGYYPNIVAELRKGNDAGATADAIGASPWGSSGKLIRQILGKGAKGTGPQPSGGSTGAGAVGSGSSTAPINGGGATATNASFLSSLTPGGIQTDIEKGLARALLDVLTPLIDLAWNFTLISTGGIMMLIGLILLARTTTAGQTVTDDAAKGAALAIPGVGEEVAAGSAAGASSGFIKGGLVRWSATGSKGKATAAAGARQRSDDRADAQNESRLHAAQLREEASRRNASTRAGTSATFSPDDGFGHQQAKQARQTKTATTRARRTSGESVPMPF